MKRSALKRLAAIFGCTMVLTAAMPAFADDIAGDWLFDTSKFADNDCQITGRMTFTQTKIKNTYTCLFVSEQICGKINGNLYIKVQQSCTAQRIGKQVAIKSKVNKVIERRPAVPNPEDWYLADNFIVQLSNNKAEMNGEHYDEQRHLKARFWRDVELVG
ncbi:MAG: hypothetical protein ABL956_10720 [Hyphomonadaceae bacterium]